MLNPINNSVDTNIHAIDRAAPANPVTPAPLDWPCPNNARVLITYAKFTFVTINANRFPLLYIVPAAGQHNLLAASDTAINALTTTNVYFLPGYPATLYDAIANTLYLPLPPRILMEPGDTLRLTVHNIAGGDALGNIRIAYQQWIIA